MSSAAYTVLRFRPMLKGDLNEIVAIEECAYTYPWSKTIFADCIRVGYDCLVLENNQRIDAYGIMSAAAGEAHILNLCVRPELQGCGLARRMLDHLLELARIRDAQTMFLEVRPSNQAALRLYAAAGFCELGLRRNYYPAKQGREDALVMAKEL